MLDGETVGAHEVDDDLTRRGANLAFAGWADECNHSVRDDLHGRGIGSWLAANAGAWPRPGGTTRPTAYIIDNNHTEAWIRYYSRYGLTPIIRATRDWQRWPRPAIGHVKVQGFDLACSGRGDVRGAGVIPQVGAVARSD